MTASAQDRVAVSLQTLIDLAKPAALLKWPPRRPRATAGGNYLSPFKGRGMVFAETRLYQPGDDVRRMDWRVTARTDKPHSKIFQEERERPLFISIDYGPTMQFATRGVFKAVQAARLAALLAWSALQQGDRIGGQLFSDQGCQEFKPNTGKSAMLRFFNALVQPSFSNPDDNTLERALARLQHHARPGSRIYIISDFRGLDAAAENHLALLARHCEVILLQIYDPLEIRLPDSGRYRFTDGSRDVVVDSADKRRLQHYQQRFVQRQQHLKQLAQRYGMTFWLCSTADNPSSLLATVYLQ